MAESFRSNNSLQRNINWWRKIILKIGKTGRNEAGTYVYNKFA
jgi:hypothetical protein